MENFEQSPLLKINQLLQRAIEAGGGFVGGIAINKIGNRRIVSFETEGAKTTFASFLKSIGINYDENDENCLWIVHNLIEIARAGKEPERLLTLYLEEDWNEWLSLLQEILQIVTYRNSDGENHAVKSFMLGFGDDGEFHPRASFIKASQRFDLELKQRIVQLLGQKLQWLDDNEQSIIMTENPV